jgi:hypothetical protein
LIFVKALLQLLQQFSSLSFDLPKPSAYLPRIIFKARHSKSSPEALIAISKPQSFFIKHLSFPPLSVSQVSSFLFFLGKIE